jgi:sugar O-acyltransferase (sialic acid O-acetyltransferase NeuD family)
MSKNLLIVGAGEFAEIAWQYFTYDSEYSVVGFVVERDHITDEKVFDLPVIELEKIEESFSNEEVWVHIAISSTKLNRVRERIFFDLKRKGYRFANYVSSHSFVWNTVELGENIFIFENNVVQHGVKIGTGTVLWSGNHIGHRSEIGDFCFLSSHVVISGFCKIGIRCFFGVNASIADKVIIEKDTFVGLGSVINKSSSNPGAIITGNPAKISKVSAYRYFKVAQNELD